MTSRLRNPAVSVLAFLCVHIASSFVASASHATERIWSNYLAGNNGGTGFAFIENGLPCENDFRAFAIPFTTPDNGIQYLTS